MAKMNKAQATPTQQVQDIASETTTTIAEPNDASVMAENVVLRKALAEMSQQLAAHEKVGDSVLVNVNGKTGRVIGNLRLDGKILSKQQVAADQNLVRKLVDSGSHLIQFI